MTRVPTTLAVSENYVTKGPLARLLRSSLAQSGSEVVMYIRSHANNLAVQRGWLHLLALAFTLLLGCPAAKAQKASEASDWSERGARRSLAAVLQSPGALDFIDVSAAGAGGRPRGALRFRFESAARALRGFGVEADECRTLVRTTSRRASPVAGSSDSPRLGVVVSLSCSFF